MEIAIIGGGIAGLAAAEVASKDDHLVLFDEQGYSGERSGAWGEFIHDYSEFPREEDVEGLVRRVDHAKLQVVEGDKIIDEAEFKSEDPMVIDRSDFEKAWYEDINDNIEFRNERVTPEDFIMLTHEFDLVIDCSGARPLSHAATEKVPAQDERIRTVSASIKGDFEEYYPNHGIVAGENFLAFINTKSSQHAVCGIGWNINEMPDNPFEAFKNFCQNVGIPVPEEQEMVLGSEPVEGSIPEEKCAFSMNDCDVRLAGDAAGLVNALNHFGNLNAALSGIHAVEASSNQEYIDYLEGLEGMMPLTGRIGDLAMSRLGEAKFAELISENSEEVHQEDYLEPKNASKLIQSLKDIFSS